MEIMAKLTAWRELIITKKKLLQTKESMQVYRPKKHNLYSL